MRPKACSALGVDAKFRPRNDIEVDGRKISGTGGFFDGDVLIYQGTVLVDMNPQQMVGALNIREAKSPSTISTRRSSAS